MGGISASRHQKPADFQLFLAWQGAGEQAVGGWVLRPPADAAFVGDRDAQAGGRAFRPQRAGELFQENACLMRPLEGHVLQQVAAVERQFGIAGAVGAVDQQPEQGTSLQAELDHLAGMDAAEFTFIDGGAAPLHHRRGGQLRPVEAQQFLRGELPWLT